MHKEAGSQSKQYRAPTNGRLLWTLGALLILGGALWLLRTGRGTPAVAPPTPAHVTRLTSGDVATMDSPAFSYSPGWQVHAHGADPAEPTDAWATPAGIVTFDFQGRELALKLATGDFWGYVFVTVDDAPASRLPVIPGNTDSRGLRAGYKPLYAPEAQRQDGPSETWLVVHRAADAGPHRVRVEVWRSWGQTPLRAVAVDAVATDAPPVWPGVLLLASGVLAFMAAVILPRARPIRWALPVPRSLAVRRDWARARLLPLWGVTVWVAATGGALAVAGVVFTQWWLCLLGIVLLAFAGFVRPALWLAAFLAALPFYFAITLPLLPNRHFSIIDLGVMGGLVVVAVNLLLLAPAHPRRRPSVVEILAVVLAAWALVSASAADNRETALHEWRLVFLYGALFLLTIAYALHGAQNPSQERRLLVGAWLAGATVMAAIGLWQFGTGAMTITAEGVQRVRGLYGSPNNLALYLERTLAVTLALGLFLPRAGIPRGGRWLLLAAALVQGGALLLTFSKGGLLLAVPAVFVVLWLGGLSVLRRQGRPTTPLWGLAALAALLGLGLLPFLGTERFQRLLDLTQGTGFLRLQLWRSSWQMALDYPWLGVGPDNFLYRYRSGYLLPAAWQEPNLNHPHNWFLDWWTRLGVPGLVLGMAYWTSGVWTVRRAWQRATGADATGADATGADATGADQALLLGILAACAAALAHGLIDVSYALPDLMLVWSLLFALATNVRERPEGELEE